MLYASMRVPAIGEAYTSKQHITIGIYSCSLIGQYADAYAAEWKMHVVQAHCNSLKTLLFCACGED